MKKVLQFEVWNDCNNGCTFCFNKNVYNTTIETKLKNLDIILNKISNLKTWDEYCKLGLIGGEFFQGQLENNEVKNKFFELIKKINWLLENDYLKEYWVTAALTFEKQIGLFEHLDLISDKYKVWICTSYDTVGRFKNEKMLNSWKFNMKELKRRYPEINLNTTTILTGSFIEDYLAGNFNINNFKNEFQTTWFSKPPLLPPKGVTSKDEYNEKVIQNFFPKRQRFLEFLLKLKYQEPEDYDKLLFNINLRSDELVKPNLENDAEREITSRDKKTFSEKIIHIENENYNGNNEIKDITASTNKHCKHGSDKEYCPYVDSDECFFCDKEMIKNL